MGLFETGYYITPHDIIATVYIMRRDIIPTTVPRRGHASRHSLSRLLHLGVLLEVLELDLRGVADFRIARELGLERDVDEPVDDQPAVLVKALLHLVQSLVDPAS